MQRIVDFSHTKICDIFPPDFDHRLGDNDENFNELVESIKTFGILLPLLLKPVGAKFEVVAGHRRYQAAKINGHEVVPSTIINGSDEELEILKLHENLKRKDLSHVDQGYTFIKLHQKFKLTEEQIAVLTGKSIAYVSQHMSLVSGDPKVLHSVANDQITFSVGREIVKVKNDDDRKQILDTALNNGCTAIVAQSWVHEANREREKQINIPEDEQTPFIPPVHMVPVYPCFSCNIGFEAQQLQYIRFCPVCYPLIVKSFQERPQ